MGNAEEVKIYENLWRRGLLLSPYKDFPTFETKKDQLTPGPEVLKGQVTSLVRRFKVRMSQFFIVTDKSTIVLILKSSKFINLYSLSIN